MVIEAHDKGLAQASRNIPELRIMLPTQLNAYAVLNCDKLVNLRDEFATPVICSTSDVQISRPLSIFRPPRLS